MIVGISYWAFFGTIYLLILTYKDFKDNMLVDDRHNFFMMGVSISLLSHINVSFWYLLALIIMTIIVSIFIAKTKVLGEADVKTMGWMFYGFGIFGVGVLLTFFVIFTFILILQVIIKKLYFKFSNQKEKPIPFYIVLLMVFVINCITWGLYIN